VNFEKSLVLVATVPGPNRVLVRPQLEENGNVRFMAAGTRIGGPGFGYALVQVPRAGVKSVNGKPLDAGAGQADEDRIEVRVVGRVDAGLVAIGGETTGTTITSGAVVWELDFGGHAAHALAAEQASGQRARVTGRLERRAGVEIAERWIVHVTAFEAVQ
jgi:hypothetical protein